MDLRFLSKFDAKKARNKREESRFLSIFWTRKIDFDEENKQKIISFWIKIGQKVSTIWRIVGAK